MHRLERHHGHERGQVTEVSWDADGERTNPIYACAHCDLHWEPQIGSGIRRGICGRCGGLTCGRPSCNALACTHWEQRLENIENGRPLDFRPIIISVPVAVPG